jgi:hypothetical protein
MAVTRNTFRYDTQHSTAQLYDTATTERQEVLLLVVFEVVAMSFRVFCAALSAEHDSG